MLSTAFASLYVSATNAIAAVAAAAPPTLTNKKVEPTTLDWVGSIMGLVTLGFSLLVLLGMAGWMTYKTLTQHETLITSWGSPQEESFAPYTEISERIHSKSWLLGLAGAAILTVAALGLYFGVAPEKDKIGDTMDLSTFDKKGKAPAAPAPAPAP